MVEVSLPESRTKDRTEKRQLHARLGVLEYFMFDPVYVNIQHEGRLQGYWLRGGRSVAMGPGGPAGSATELESDVLGLSLLHPANWSSNAKALEFNRRDSPRHRSQALCESVASESESLLPCGKCAVATERFYFLTEPLSL